MAQLHAQTTAMLDGLNAKFGDEDVFTATAGQKYDRITKCRIGDPYSATVHAFVDRATGGIMKADGYKRPAAGIRYPDAASALAVADRSGGYLYWR